MTFEELFFGKAMESEKYKKAEKLFDSLKKTVTANDVTKAMSIAIHDSPFSEEPMMVLAFSILATDTVHILFRDEIAEKKLEEYMQEKKEEK